MLFQVAKWKENIQRQGNCHPKCNKRLYFRSSLIQTNWFSTVFSTNGRCYITLNREMLAQSCLQIIINPILKNQRQNWTITISAIQIRTPEIPHPNHIYELDCNTFQLPEGFIWLDVMHPVDHKMPRTSKIIILNTNNTISSLAKHSPIVTLAPAGKWEQIQKIKWSVLQDSIWTMILEVAQEPETIDKLQKAQLLPKIPGTTNLQLEPDTPKVSSSIPDADIPEITRKWLQELLNVKYSHIVSKSAADIGRTNLIELDIPTEGPPIASNHIQYLWNIENL